MPKRENSILRRVAVAMRGACNNLGILYGNGLGVREDRAKAKELFGKACDLGSQLGCDNYKKYNNAF